MHSSQDTALFGVILRQNCHLLILTFFDWQEQYNPHLPCCLLTYVRGSSPLHRLSLFLLGRHHTQTLRRPVKQLSQMAAALLLSANVKKHTLTLEQCTRGEKSLRTDTYWALVVWLSQRSLRSSVNPWSVSLSRRLMTEITLKSITQKRNCLISQLFHSHLDEGNLSGTKWVSQDL